MSRAAGAEEIAIVAEGESRNGGHSRRRARPARMLCGPQVYLQADAADGNGQEDRRAGRCRHGREAAGPDAFSLFNAVADAIAYKPGFDQHIAHDRGAGAEGGAGRVPGPRPRLPRVRPAALRVPARYVVGYLLAPEDTKVTETHAWAEAWVPDIGWVGFDRGQPALCPTDRYVRLGCGLDAADAAPIRGNVSWASRRSGLAPRSTSARQRAKVQSSESGRRDPGPDAAVAWRGTWKRADTVGLSGGEFATDMTYCVGLKLKAGLVLLSDTRTNAGVDNIARFRKMFVFEEPGDRVVALMCGGQSRHHAGRRHASSAQADEAEPQSDPEIESLMTCDTLYRGAQLVGEAMREVQKRDRAEIEAQGAAADATIIMAGQRRGRRAAPVPRSTPPAISSKRATTRPTCRSASTSMASRSSTA
jgi:hypothetical protein